MNFLEIGLHIGSKDIQQIFEQLNHTLTIWSLSDHYSLMGWKRAKVDVVNERTWWNLNQDVCNKFYERYKNELKHYDGFVTFYPPAFSLLFKKFDKPILMVVPLRFDMPFFNDPIRWNWLIEKLQKGIDSEQIIPIVNNKLDQQYFINYVNRKIDYIPGLCEYTNVKYIGDKKEFLYCSKFKQFLGWLPDFPLKIQQSNYSWQDLVHFKALVCIPYTNTTISFVEQYTMNIPMLFPSQEFLLSLWQQYRNVGVMSELSHRKVFGCNSGTPAGVRFNGLDLNDYDNEESFIYWSNLSDYYDQENYPYIQYFDSIIDLKYKLLELDFESISVNMERFNVIKKQNVLSSWRKLLSKL